MDRAKVPAIFPTSQASSAIPTQIATHQCISWLTLAHLCMASCAVGAGPGVQTDAGIACNPGAGSCRKGDHGDVDGDGEVLGKAGRGPKQDILWYGSVEIPALAC